MASLVVGGEASALLGSIYKLELELQSMFAAKLCDCYGNRKRALVNLQSVSLFIKM